jgi:type IV pilus biogenesis protein CpaD/CtpE
MRRRIIPVLAVAVATGLLLTGCAGEDRSFEQRIPAAIEESGLGITEPWAETTLDGFTTTLAVGGTVADGMIDVDAVRELVSIAVRENTVSARYLEISLRDAARDRVDVSDALAELGARPRGDGSIPFEDAEKIADEATS